MHRQLISKEKTQNPRLPLSQGREKQVEGKTAGGKNTKERCGWMKVCLKLQMKTLLACSITQVPLYKVWGPAWGRPICEWEQWGWWGTGTGCPEMWWLCHPWLLRPGWIRLWASWPSCGWPCLLQRSWTWWPLKVPSNSKDSVILWFYEWMSAKVKSVIKKRRTLLDA